MESKFFAGMAERVMLTEARQIRDYFLDDRIRAAVQARVDATITDETRVVLAHSLGSVAAYEVLCARPFHHVRALVTFGSQLGTPNLVFHRLRPAPAPVGDTGELRGAWPGGGHLTWTNLADTGDVTALVKDLRPLFGPRVRSVVVDNGVRAHSALSYLGNPACAAAIIAGLGLEPVVIPGSASGA